MGYLVSEEEFINNNIFKYEERMNNQYARFLDKTPTYVTYYNISNVNSTVDNGFQNVESLLGDNSSIRFNKVENFPIYGIEQIVLNLVDEEEGLTTEYDGDAVILPNTVQPIPGDFFVINHLQIKLIFMITNIEFDTIKSNNFYKVSYTLKSVNDSDQLDKQVSDKFKCLVSNIGTEEKCLIKEDEYYQLFELAKEFNRLADDFILYFYSEKFNSFLTYENNEKIYDPYLSLFLKSNKIFSSKDNYKTICPEVIGNEKHITVGYARSIYRHLERGLPLPHQTYFSHVITDMTSPFVYYGTRMKNVAFPGNLEYIPRQVIDDLNHTNLAKSNYILSIISKYIGGNIDSVYTLDIETLKTVEIVAFDRMNAVLYAILLFILKKSYDKFISY